MNGAAYSDVYVKNFLKAGTVTIGSHDVTGELNSRMTSDNDIEHALITAIKGEFPESAFNRPPTSATTGWQQSLLRVPEGVTVIANQAAREVTSITEVELPSTLVEVRASAFSSITGITRVTCLAATPPSCGSDFTDAVYANATLYVPMRSLELYRNAEVWSNFQHIEGIDTGDEPATLGDVNGDGKVNISDVSALIGYLLDDSNEICTANADVNDDTRITIADVSILISMLLDDSE